MKITISQYEIKSDPLNYKVTKIVPKVDKEGQPIPGETVSRFVGYYSSTERVCGVIILEQELKDSDAENLAELVELLLKTKREIIQEVQNAKIEKMGRVSTAESTPN